jgi:hypothetical protein
MQIGLAALAIFPSAISCIAGVIVSQNVGPGATSWPGAPALSTIANPSSAPVSESFNAIGGCTNYGQTFTITGSDCTLQSISIYAGAGTGTAAGTNVTLRLFDLGNINAPNPSPYAPGPDLFNSGNGLAIPYVPQTAGVLRFDFTDSDQVTLQSGRMYVFEINGPLNSFPLLWYRSINDTFSGGAAYRNRSWINGNNAREFTLAVYTVSNVNTNPWVPAGNVYHAFAALDNGVNQDGANPAAGLALSDEVLFGTTLNGGQQSSGIAFAMTRHIRRVGWLGWETNFTEAQLAAAALESEPFSPSKPTACFRSCEASRRFMRTPPPIQGAPVRTACWRWEMGGFTEARRPAVQTGTARSFP